MIKLYNSLTNTLEEFKPITPGEVSMYVCGPTVYNYPHIGNARPMIVFDTFKKMFEASDLKVKYISNYTDVDDKIIKKAIEEGVSESVISERFIEAYNKDRASLRVDMPHKAPRVTENMDSIISFIENLVQEGYAYEADGDVYFRVSKIDNYGQLSNQKVDDLIVGARIDQNIKKENPLDFTLWKRTEEGIKWNSKFSLGRPGWHTECVVMIQKEFNADLIDIHGGGLDLKFPHHENEIAQSCACKNSNLANYWLHNGMINVDGMKMSKSLGNVVWAKDIVEKFGPNLVRWLVLSSHYRSPLSLNDDTIENAQKELEKITNSLKQSYVKIELSNNHIKEVRNEELFASFLFAMQDDLNTPNAFKALFEATKLLNATLRAREVDFDVLSAIIVSIEDMLAVLGVHIDRIILSEEDKEFHLKWKQTLKNKDFASADVFRAELIERGIV